jgi:hypothetical protein
MAFRDERLRVVGIGGTLEATAHTAASMVQIADRLGKLVVELAGGLNPESRRTEAVGVAV